jgi:hypothetical protein
MRTPPATEQNRSPVATRSRTLRAAPEAARDELRPPSNRDEVDGGSSEASDRDAESGDESEGDGVRATADPAFSSGWYEAHRGEYIRSRFAIPERFDPHYPVSFEPETVRHYRTFCAGTATRDAKAKRTPSTPTRRTSY